MTYLPYPPDRYAGSTGEQSAALRRDTFPPELDRRNTKAHYLATGAVTDGQFGLYRWEMNERNQGPDPHFHKSITESFYVLSGNVRLHDGEGWLDAEAGDFLYVPQGGIHGFKNESGSPASMLLLFTPGAPREDYFERVHTVGEMDPEEAEEFFLRHDTFWV